MKHSDVFGSLYIMSPCCLSTRPTGPPDLANPLEAVETPEESTKLPFFCTGATIADKLARSSCFLFTSMQRSS